MAGNQPGIVREALAGNPEAIHDLRRQGPAGLDMLLEAAAPQITGLKQNKIRLDAEECTQLRASLDAVARQRDAWASGLYWFTELDAAKAEAAKTGKPILSLRLLGNLDEEYSCANSRFFRTILYANTAVSAHLRTHFVLHWKSVRPAPLLTIDMGDGRRIKRTITGNSIHYLLDADGQVLDAFPGIYSSAAFLAALDRASHNFSGKDPSARTNRHGIEAHEACLEWLQAAVQAGSHGDKARAVLTNPDTAARILAALVAEAFPGSKTLPAPLPPEAPRFAWPRSQIQRFGGDPVVAMPGPAHWKIETIREFPYPTEFDPPKAMVERPIMKQTVPAPAPNVREIPPPAKAALPLLPIDPLQPPSGSPDPYPPPTQATPGNANEALDPASPQQAGPTLAGRMTPALWEKIVAPLQFTVQLDEGSLRFMMQKLPLEIILPEELASGHPSNPTTAFGRQVRRFEEAIGRDMVRNEYYYHTIIHQWLEEDRSGALSRDVEALNQRVYQDLFLTPDADAWLGLVPDDTYTALEKDGCACDKNAPPMRPKN